MAFVNSQKLRSRNVSSNVRETNLSREHSFGEEGGKFMGEALVLKRASCSVGNFATKLSIVVFKSEELDNHNCTGTGGKMALDPGKMAVIKKYVKFYPCAPAQEESTWRKCVVAIDEFLWRTKWDGVVRTSIKHSFCKFELFERLKHPIVPNRTEKSK